MLTHADRVSTDIYNKAHYHVGELFDRLDQTEEDLEELKAIIVQLNSMKTKLPYPANVLVSNAMFKFAIRLP